MTSAAILPRFIRRVDAPGYLGMDRNRFDAEVRPYLVEIPIGVQGIAFDRVDLDAWADDYKSRNGRRPKAQDHEDDTKCQTKNEGECLGSAGATGSGTSRRDAKKPPAGGSGKARARLSALRQNGS